MKSSSDEIKILKQLLKLAQSLKFPDGQHMTAIPDVFFELASNSTNFYREIQDRSFCVILQGKKSALLGDEIHSYSPGGYLVVSIDLPVIGRIENAVPSRPYVGIRLDLVPELLQELYLNSAKELEAPVVKRGIEVKHVNVRLLEAFQRLVNLLKQPEDINALAPLITREIYYLLLKDDKSGTLRQIAIMGSGSERICRAIEFIKKNLQKKISIEKLAKSVGMSIATFHRHFKQLTLMTPLNYQKCLRLHEARRLLLTQDIDAAEAGFEVGYESPSQFSREYNRMFGVPPKKDLKRFKGRRKI